jgi:hypothetical protein
LQTKAISSSKKPVAIALAKAGAAASAAPKGGMKSNDFFKKLMQG